MRIVFMGTPDFAVPCLTALTHHSYDVAGVFTQPDKPKGRGRMVQPPPVKQLAERYEIPVFQPATLKQPQTIQLVKQLQPDLIVVVAYGKILPPEILSIPHHGCINLHASLLPKYRGAGPIQWSILNGETITGVTTMYMEEGLDTGDVLLGAETEIGQNETAGELQGRLAVMGADVLIQTLCGLQQGTLERKQQDQSLASYAPMLTKELCALDFRLPAQQVHNHIRGLSPWPCAQTMLQNKRLKVYRSEIVQGLSGECGQILCDKSFVVGCAAHTAIRFLEVQYEGAKRLPGQAFLNGKRIQKGELLLSHPVV